MLLLYALNHGFRRSARLLSSNTDEEGDALKKAQLDLSGVSVGHQPSCLSPKVAKVNQARTKRKNYIRIRHMQINVIKRYNALIDTMTNLTNITRQAHLLLCDLIQRHLFCL